jgi:hypothetical protein
MFSTFSLTFDDRAVFDLAVRAAEEKFYFIYFDVGYSDRVITFDDKEAFEKFCLFCEQNEWYFVKNNY